MGRADRDACRSIRLAGIIVDPREGGAVRSDSPAPAASAAGEKASDGVPLDYRTPYLEFWGRSPLKKSQWGCNLGQLIAEDGDRVAPEFLIVTVPDPLDTRLGYRFDAALDAVQMAIESQRWNLDRSWLPWCPAGRQLATRADLKPVIHPDSGLPLHENQPGVMMFRRPRKPEDKQPSQRLLFVLIVGESPTTGIAKQPLKTCLDVIHSYHCSRVSDRLRQVSLVGLHTVASAQLAVALPGPGTVSSLSIGLPSVLNTLGALQTLRDPDRRADVQRDAAVAGARAIGLVAGPQARSLVALRLHLRPRALGDAITILKEKFEQDAAPGRRPPKAGVHFDSTLQHEDLVMPALLEYLKGLNGGKPLGKLALLTESDTEFGNQPHAPTEVTKSPGSETTVTVMKFPFHISQVATAYNQRDRKDDRSTPTLVRPSSRLSIPFDETGNPRDVVPALSPAMTTAIDEFVMAKILETISVEDFRYIGIVATDTRDMIFLAAMIRQYCPDVQIFIPAGDLLLGHPRYVNDLSGTIVASSYPLFSMAQRWDPPYQGDHRRHLFSHEGDQGIYNAAVSLLNEGGGPFAQPNLHYFESLFDYGMPFDELENYHWLWWKDAKGKAWNLLKDTPPDNNWSWPAQTRYEQPSLWVSVVGQRGLWPVAYRRPDAIRRRYQIAEYAFRSRNPTEKIGCRPIRQAILADHPAIHLAMGRLVPRPECRRMAHVSGFICRSPRHLRRSTSGRDGWVSWLRPRPDGDGAKANVAGVSGIISIARRSSCAGCWG